MFRPYESCMHAIDTLPVPVFEVESVKFLIRPSHASRKHVSKILAPYKCDTCKQRANTFLTLRGPKGAVFLSNIPEEAIQCEPVLSSLRDLSKASATYSSEFRPELVLVTEGVFPPVNEGVDVKGSPWQHPTIKTIDVTDPETAAKFNLLWRNYGNSMDERLIKLVDPDPRHARSINLVHEAALLSDHPDHWNGPIQWIIGLNAYAASIALGKSFLTMDAEQKMCMRVFAVMTGCSNDAFHPDYHKSENIVDFVSKGTSVDGVVAMMNGRRDERTYQVSQVARAMQRENVTDERTISLSWNARDDLDLHLRTPSGQWVYYQNAKQVVGGCRLNFDANAGSNKTIDPVENISVLLPEKGRYEIYVNNFQQEQPPCNVEFQITIKVEGNTDRVWDGTWGHHMGSNSSNALPRMIKVCEVEFNETTSQEIVMSYKEAARARATNDQWEKHIGMVMCRYASIWDAKDDGWTAVNLPFSCKTNDHYMALAARSKKYLSDRCDNEFSKGNFEDLVKHAVSANQSLFVRVHDVSPGYFVCHENSEKTLHNAVFNCVVPCHYRDQGYTPMEPTKRGNARLNGEWFSSDITENSFVRVVAVLTKTHQPSFLALEGAVVPRNSANFPLGGGFYPTSLKPEFHALKSRWSARNTVTIPRASFETPVSGHTTGGFVFGDHTFYLGSMKKEVRVKVD